MFGKSRLDGRISTEPARMTSTRLAFRVWRLTRLIQNIVFLPVSLILIFLLLLSQKFFPTRIMPMNLSRVGHLGIDVEYALSEVAHRAPQNRIRLIVVPYRIDLPIANRTLFKMWRRNTTTFPALVGVPLIWAINRLRLSSHLLYLLPKHIASRFHWGSDPYGVTADGVAQLRFTRNQLEDAEERLRQMGLDLSRPFVCLHVRDDQYHAKHTGGLWTEPHSWRNLPLGNFEKAAELLAAKGFQVVRLGVHTASSFSVANEQEIFDYANNGFRDELLDIFLVSRCSFMISTSSGIDSLAQVFRRPLYNVGVLAPSQLYIHRNVYSIVQRFQRVLDGQILTLSESLALPKISDESMRQLGLQTIVNTADEIANFAAEASDRALGLWSPTEEQLKLQLRFIALLPSEFRRFQIRGGVGSHFLSSHPDWLN